MDYVLTKKGVEQAKKKSTLAREVAERATGGGPYGGYPSGILRAMYGQQKKKKLPMVMTAKGKGDAARTAKQGLSILEKKGYVRKLRPAKKGQPRPKMGHLRFIGDK